MDTRRTCRTLCSWLFFTTSCLVTLNIYAAPLLNGIAPFQQLGKDRFVAALYSDTLSDSANELIGTTQNRSIELRITADQLSPRRLNRLWIEGMAINAPADILAEEADNMVNFSKLLEDKLMRGDHLRIDYRPAQGTTVSLNGKALGKIPSDHFFDLLLRTWIGSIPLSSTFKNQLLAAGEVDQEILTLFKSITPAETRLDIVGQWHKPEPPEEEPPIAPAPALDINPAPQLSKANIALAPTLTAPAIAPAPVAATPSTETPAVANVADTPKPAAAKKVAPPTPPKTDEDDDEGAEEELTTAMLLDRQRYHSQLLRWCYKYLKYPEKAASRRQQGSVRISVAIDRDGNVTEVNTEEESPYSLLNKEALSAIDRANPFPPMPSSISGERYSFSMPIVFRLPD